MNAIPQSNKPEAEEIKFLAPVEAEYIERGTFQAGEEEAYEYGLKAGDTALIITPNVWAALHAQLEAAKGAVEALKSADKFVSLMYAAIPFKKEIQDHLPYGVSDEIKAADLKDALGIREALARCAAAGLTGGKAT